MTTFDFNRYPEYWSTITRDAYEERWDGRFELDSATNVLGFGKPKPFLPPLNMPQWMLSVIDRHLLITFSVPLVVSIEGLNAMIVGLYNGDSWDGFWYNNPAAAGSQIYPTSVSKYYDLYSSSGFITYVSAWIWVWTCNLLAPFTFFIPLDFWAAALNGYDMEKIYLIGVPWFLLQLYSIKGEDGWPLG